MKKVGIPMKKAMLYGSMVMSVVYALALAVVITFQDVFRPVYGASGLPFVLPVSDIVRETIVILAVLCMAVFLLKFSENGNIRGEIPVIVINILWLTCGSWVTAVMNVMDNMRYAAAGAEMMASYAMMRLIMGNCRPFLVFAQLLLILYAGISLGRKTYEKDIQ